MTLAPGQRLSHYELEAEIGQGGMGIVYRALDLNLDRHVALKVLPVEVTGDPARLERFQREARALAALNHPGIVTIHSVEEADGVHFLTMELVEGTTLDGLMRPGGMALPGFFDLSVALGDALSAAHERGVLHRDLKPGNIMVTAAGRVKILDFGLAKQTRPDLGPKGRASGPSSTGSEVMTSTGMVTKEGQIIGTFPYMSPEQLQGQPTDQRSDIFSLGIILYQMTTGQRPFRGDSWAELTSSIMRDTPAPIDTLRPGLPEHLGRILRRSLEKDPRRRYQSALDLRNELEDLRSDVIAGTASVASGPGSGARSAAAGTGGAGSGVAGGGAMSGMIAPAAGSGVTGGAGALGRTSAAKIAASVLVVAGIAAVSWVLWRRGGALPSGTAAPAIPAPPGAAAAPAQPPQPAAARTFSSVAILPFTNMSDDVKDEYFSDGITEELINAMAQVKDLKVTARTSVFALKGKNLGVQEIGKILGVDTVLEGSVRRSGDTLRITAQLIGAADGFHLWSDKYDRKMKDVFAIQDEIAASIVTALRPTLDPAERDALPKVKTADIQAYDQYLRGRALFYRAGWDGWQKSRAMFQGASAIDPTYALPYAGIADASSFLYLYAGGKPADLQAADEASLKALSLAPDLAESHSARGLALSLRRQYDEADREFDTAIKLNPNLFEAFYFYARACLTRGQLEKSRDLFLKAINLRPDDYQAPGILSSVYRSLGQREESDAMIRLTMEKSEARLKTDPDDARALYFGGNALIEQGQKERGLEWLDRAVAMNPTDTGTLYNVACGYALAGQPDKSIDTLQKAIDSGFAQKEWIERDGDLDSLRTQPRYKAMMARMRAPS